MARGTDTYTNTFKAMVNELEEPLSIPISLKITPADSTTVMAGGEALVAAKGGEALYAQTDADGNVIFAGDEENYQIKLIWEEDKDPEITLNNAVIHASGDDALRISDTVSCQLILVGDNTLTGDTRIGLNCRNLTIDGSGTLSISAPADYGLHATGSTCIKDGKITAESAEGTLFLSTLFQMEGGYLSSTATAEGSCGLEFAASVLSGGTLIGRGDSMGVSTLRSGPEVQIGPFSKTTLAPGETAAFSVSPVLGLAADGESAKIYSAEMTVKISESDATAKAQLSFTVQPIQRVLGVNPTEKTFASLPEGYGEDALAEQMFDVSNDGNVRLNNVRVELTGKDTDVFVLDDHLFPTYLETPEHSPFFVTPALGLAKGTYTATAVVSADDTPDVEIPLSFTVGRGALSFKDGNQWDVPAGVTETEIDPIDLLTAVQGGVGPYTFEIVSGPAWLNLSEAGLLTGTRPATAEAATTVTVKVTDSENATAEKTLNVGEVSESALFTLTFYPNGGQGEAFEVRMASSYQLPPCSFTPPTADQTFVAWAEGSVEGTQYQAGDIYTISGNQDFYAIWSDTPQNTVTPDETTFDWNNVNDGISFYIERTDASANLVEVKNGEETLTPEEDYEQGVSFGDPYVWVKDSYWHAHEGETVTLTFVMSKGNNPTAEVEIPSVYEITINIDPNAYAGYVFRHWADGVNIYPDEEYTFTPTQDCTLIFETNGGSGIDSLRKSYGTTVDLEKYEPTRAGYTFAGWYADEEWVEDITSIRLNGSKRVYAGWNPYTDVQKEDWFYREVVYAYGQGLMNGTFAPNKAISREEMAAILYRYAAFKGYDVTEQADLSAYVDAGEISGYAVEPMAWANGEELITSVSQTEKRLSPTKDATRAEVATILMRFCTEVME